MNTQEILTFATSPFVLTALALLIIQGTPNSTLARLPVVGPFVRAWLDAWARKQLRDFDEKRRIMDAEAERIVRDKEQAIKIKRIDAPTAAAQATQELQRAFGLPADIAKRLIENQVNKLPQWLSAGIYESSTDAQ